jgi:hypothetical protein
MRVLVSEIGIRSIYKIAFAGAAWRKEADATEAIPAETSVETLLAFTGNKVNFLHPTASAAGAGRC